MAGRSPARFLAPIALVAFAFALYSVVQDAREPAGGNSGAHATRDGRRRPRRASPPKKKSTKKKRKIYTVKSGDTLSGIAEKTGVSLETLNDAQPRPRPGDALAGPEAQAAASEAGRPHARGRCCAALALAAAPAQAARSARLPDSVKAPSAIVIEVSTGTVACARRPTRPRSIGSTTKLMTALLTLEEAKLCDTFKAVELPRRRRSSPRSACSRASG